MTSNCDNCIFRGQWCEKENKCPLFKKTRNRKKERVAKMAYIETVVNGLNDIGGFIAGRVGFEQARNFLRTIDDAIALLKEQEAKWIHREDMDFIDKYNCTHFHGMCTNCGLVHDFIDGHTGQYLYCPQCGRAAKWE